MLPTSMSNQCDRQNCPFHPVWGNSVGVQLLKKMEGYLHGLTRLVARLQRLRREAFVNVGPGKGGADYWLSSQAGSVGHSRRCRATQWIGVAPTAPRWKTPSRAPKPPA